MYDYWVKQDTKPLYPSILWSKPERRDVAGKLLVVGGNIHAIGAPSTAYADALAAGAGQVKVAMPNKTKKLLGKSVHVDIEFVASTPTGSLSKDAFGDLSSLIHWSDAVVYAGDFSRNSETAVLLENLASMSGIQCYTKDAVDYFDKQPALLLERESTLIVASVAQLQRHLTSLKILPALTYDMGMVSLVNVLHQVTLTRPAAIITNYQDTFVLAHSGIIVTTALKRELPIWRGHMATIAVTWYMQQPTKPLEALATACVLVADPQANLL